MLGFQATSHGVVKRGSHLTTDITLQDADDRTLPSVGPELLDLVQKARDDDILPKLWNCNVIRLVDELWLAPDMCDKYFARCLYCAFFPDIT